MRRKKRNSVDYRDVELNIMPFIDVFSMLNTFLLFSAAFISIGILEVQVPFLSSAPPPDKKENERILKIDTDLSRQTITLTTEWSEPPQNEDKQTYENTEAGIKEFHQKLLQIKEQSPKTDLVTLFTDEDVTYEEITKVVDAARLRWDGDPPGPMEAEDKEDKLGSPKLFPKIVLGSVIL